MTAPWQSTILHMTLFLENFVVFYYLHLLVCSLFRRSVYSSSSIHSLKIIARSKSEQCQQRRRHGKLCGQLTISQSVNQLVSRAHLHLHTCAELCNVPRESVQQRLRTSVNNNVGTRLCII